MSEERIHAPYFFETSANQHNYPSMAKLFFDKHHEAKKYKNFYFLIDGATPHFENKYSPLPKRLISKKKSREKSKISAKNFESCF